MKIGLVWKLNFLVCVLYMSEFVILFGIRLGVNCMCLVLSLSVWVKDCMMRVFVIFGIFLRRMCLWVSRVISRLVMVLVWLMMVLLILVWIWCMVCWSVVLFVV